MTDHLFDTFVREKLADHASPVPGGLWEKIEDATAEKERKKGIALIPRAYRVAALLIVCATASALLFWPRQASQQKELTQQQQQPSSITPSTQHNNQIPVAPGVSADSSSATASSVAPAPLFIAPAGEAITPLRPADNRRAIMPAVPDGAEATASMLPAASANNEATALQPVAAEQPFVFLPAESISLKTLSSYQSSGLQQLLQNQSYKLLPVIRCPPVRSTFPKDLYVEAYASPDLIIRNSSANYGGADYLARKDSSQQLRASFTAGVRVSKALTENLLVKTGIQYSQINEVFNYRTENERKQVTVITIHRVPQAPGDTIEVRDTSSYEQIGYLQKKTYNKYKSIDIPLLFSYEWGNDQWRFAANVGAIVNLHSWYKGEILDTSYQAVSVKNTTNEVYKSNIGLGLYAGFSIIKPIGENTDLFAEPYFRYNLGDMTNQGQAFNQRTHTAGLSLGIRYRLKGGQRY